VHSLVRAATSASLALCAAATAGAAQSATPATSPAAPRQVLSIQPLQAIAGVVSGDYERAIRNGFTLGIGASYWDFGTLAIDDGGDLGAKYVSAEVKARYYPSETPFRGFSIGLTGGAAHASFHIFDNERESANGVKVGVEADYNWLLGRSDRLAIALGLGGKRIWYGRKGERLAGAYPTSRIAIGWAF
jgi:hypothetical protein